MSSHGNQKDPTRKLEQTGNKARDPQQIKDLELSIKLYVKQ